MLVHVIVKQDCVNVTKDLQEMPANEVILYSKSFKYNLLIHFYLKLVTCHKDCSGHGVCTSLWDLSLFAGADYDPYSEKSGDGIGPYYLGWDRDLVQICECDDGYYGSDCSLSK